jgi:hypothetical protein
VEVLPVIFRASLLLLSIGLISWMPNHAQTGAIARLPSVRRTEVMARARALANHSWVCGSSNVRASCSRKYVSDWKPGQRITGLPYRWGGVDSAEEFDQKLNRGLAAGAHSRYGVLACAAGIDCSGYVSLCWGLSTAGHAYSTSNLRQIAGKPKYNWFTEMKEGDVLNKAGSHVVLFAGYNADGTINVCEASGSKARVVCGRTTWSRFKSYIPLQYKGIDD